MALSERKRCQAHYSHHYSYPSLVPRSLIPSLVLSFFVGLISIHLASKEKEEAKWK